MNITYQKAIVCFILVILSFTTSAQIRPYRYPEGLKPSRYYKVKTTDSDIFVFGNPVASFATFDILGEKEIFISSDRDIKWVDIRPRSLGLTYELSENTIKIKIRKACNFSIEINGSLEQPLFILANLPETKPDTLEKGLIFFKAGKEYTINNQILNSNQHVYIEGGAIVHGSFNARRATGIQISGNGVLDGSFNDSLFHSRAGIGFTECSDIQIKNIILSNGTTWEIVSEKCRNVKINNVKIVSHHGGDDGMDIVRSRDVEITNCFIRTKDDCIAIKANGSYPDSVITQNVTVRNCIIWNGPWGNGFEIGFELNASEVKNITFENCDVIHVEKGAVFSIHNAGKANVHDVKYHNIRIEDAKVKLFDFAIFLSQYSDDAPGREAVKKARYLYGAWDGVLSETATQRVISAEYRGQINNIFIKDIYILEGNNPFSIFYGHDSQHQVSNVFVNGLYVYGKKLNDITVARFYLENAQHIKLSNY